MNFPDEFYDPVAAPKIFYRYDGIVYGDLLGIYAIFLSQHMNYPGAPQREPCFRAFLLLLQNIRVLVCQ